MSMIYLTGGIGGVERRTAYAARPHLGMLLGAAKWRRPWCQHFAYDNDVYGAWDRWITHRTWDTPEVWWQREGEANWLRMIDRVADQELRPLFCVLPDVVADWPATVRHAHKYLPLLRERGLPVALALQDGCDFQEAEALEPDWVFVGGTKRWKWNTLPAILRYFQPRGARVHVGRANGFRAIRYCRMLGVDCADGTGLARHFDAILPHVDRAMGHRPEIQARAQERTAMRSWASESEQLCML